MAFTVNTGEVYDGNQNNGPMPEGDYEVVIKEVKEDKANTGTPYINVELVVRNDINQAYKNKHLWYQIWASKDTGEYNAKGINTVSAGVGVSNGAQFNSIEDWGKFLSNKPVVAVVKHDVYNGKTKERVSFIVKTKITKCTHEWNATSNSSTPNTSTQNTQGFRPIPTADEDDDLPF